MKKRSAEYIVRHLGSLADGTHIIEHPDGHLERRASETDWSAVDTLTEEDLAAAARSDPDAVPPDFDWSAAVLVVPPKKKAISIRVDEDVLDFFKDGGAGYQRRMNAVLRSYMLERRKRRRA
jgi:uncharacterized protein (DUF4415 family)